MKKIFTILCMITLFLSCATKQPEPTPEQVSNKAKTEAQRAKTLADSVKTALNDSTKYSRAETVYANALKIELQDNFIDSENLYREAAELYYICYYETAHKFEKARFALNEAEKGLEDSVKNAALAEDEINQVNSNSEKQTEHQSKRKGTKK